MSPRHAEGIVQEGTGWRQRPPEQRRRAQKRLALVLAAVAGLVDAVGFIVLFGIFTAQMSGNSVRLGVYVGRGEWSSAVFRLVPVPAFVIGVFLGILVAETAARAAIRSGVAILLGIELALLVAFVVVSWPHFHDGSVRVGSRLALYGLVALLSGSMGLQTAALRRVGERSVRTTYITGMLTDLASELARVVGRRRSRPHPASSSGATAEPVSAWYAGLLGAIWIAYLSGAALGTLAELHWHLGAMIPALVVLAVVVAVDLIAPVADPPPTTARR
jgi:uncharacterized membrane protein YoaK (UPF0700 family)